MGDDAALVQSVRAWTPSPAIDPTIQPRSIVGEPAFTKHDAGKPRTDLLPPRALLAVSRVLALGASKYGADNWTKCQEPARYIGAALRHVFTHMAGEKVDAESGESHLTHAACCLLFLVELGEKGPPHRA